ncbi:MAG: hypothetical protein GY830_10180 [Bacteroidetes bacterium]|nr:hypothetical protein [Bacteroidota bacterium]
MSRLKSISFNYQIIIILFSLFFFSAKQKSIDEKRINSLVKDLEKIYSKNQNKFEIKDLDLINKNIKTLSNLFIETFVSFNDDLSTKTILFFKDEEYFKTLAKIIKKKYNKTLGEFFKMRDEKKLQECVIEAFKQNYKNKIDITDLFKFKSFYDLINTKMHPVHAKNFKNEKIYDIIKLVFQDKSKEKLIEYFFKNLKKDKNIKNEDVSKEAIDKVVEDFKKEMFAIGSTILKTKFNYKNVSCYDNMPAKHIKILMQIDFVKQKFLEAVNNLEKDISNIISTLISCTSPEIQTKNKAIFSSKLDLKEIYKFKSLYILFKPHMDKLISNEYMRNILKLIYKNQNKDNVHDILFNFIISQKLKSK